MTEFEEYFTSILDGKIVACEKMKLVSEMLLNQMYSPEEYHFDYQIAKEHTDFIERFCKQPSGKLGVPLNLQLFQKARFQALFGFVDDNNLRQFNECLIVEGRKNGKTTETAAVELDLLVNDSEGSPQIYNLATKKDQANLGYQAVAKMRKQSPALKSFLKEKVSGIYCEANYGFIKAMASDTNGLDGLDTHCAVVDELAALKNRDLYDLIKQSMGSRSQPLMFCITTNGFVRQGIFDAQYEYAKNILEGKAINKHFLPFIYELDSPDEWDKEECWIKANPGIDTIKSRTYLRQMVQKAKDDISFKPTVMTKDFNLKQTGTDAWLRYEDIESLETFDISEFDYCIGSFDAADTTDLNSAKLIFARPNDDKVYFYSMYWIPQSVLDEQELKGDRQERDSVPYSLWVEQGLMRTCPGNKCDKKIFIEWFSEMRDKYGILPQWFYYDSWHISDEELRAFKMEFGENCMIPVRQGVYSMSQPMKELKADFQAHKIVYNHNPIDEWCLMNTEVKIDTNGNIQPVKGLQRTKRIDGAVTFIMGYKGYMDRKDLFVPMNKEKNNGFI